MYPMFSTYKIGRTTEHFIRSNGFHGQIQIVHTNHSIDPHNRFWLVYIIAVDQAAFGPTGLYMKGSSFDLRFESATYIMNHNSGDCPYFAKS